jgi:integrase
MGGSSSESTRHFVRHAHRRINSQAVTVGHLERHRQECAQPATHERTTAKRTLPCSRNFLTVCLDQEIHGRADAGLPSPPRILIPADEEVRLNKLPPKANNSIGANCYGDGRNSMRRGPGAARWKPEPDSPHGFRRTAATRMAGVGIIADDVSPTRRHTRPAPSTWPHVSTHLRCTI